VRRDLARLETERTARARAVEQTEGQTT
jgi:hypothetical protein